MPRLLSILPRVRTFPSSRTRLFATTHPLHTSNPTPSTIEDKSGTSAHDSTPGWSGREGRDHAVNRPAHDVQADSAHQAMKDHKQGKEGSDAISRKDEGNNKEKAKEEFPEAPDTIGVNEERGSKGW